MQERELQFNVVGQPTIDRVEIEGKETKESPGGGIYFTAGALAKLGCPHVEATMKSPSDIQAVSDLEMIGVDVHLLPSRDDSIVMEFINLYNERGDRRQLFKNMPESITATDYVHFSQGSSKRTTILAPLVEGDMDITSLVTTIAEKEGGPIWLTPQGCFRTVENETVYHTKPKNESDFLSMLPSTQGIVLSLEDITFGDTPDLDFLDHMREHCPLVVVTKGENGLTIFEKGLEPIDISVFSLSREEMIDPTGAGDSCAAAFIWHYTQWRNVKEAGAFAAFYSALKLMDVGGNEGGINSLPTKAQVSEFIISNATRVEDFCKKNAINFSHFVTKLSAQ